MAIGRLKRPDASSFAFGSTRRLFLLRRVEEDCAAILRPDVGPLPVNLGGIVGAPKHVEQLVVGYLRRVVFDFDYFGVASAIRTHILVGWIFCVATLITR